MCNCQCCSWLPVSSTAILVVGTCPGTVLVDGAWSEAGHGTEYWRRRSAIGTATNSLQPEWSKIRRSEHTYPSLSLCCSTGTCTETVAECRRDASQPHRKRPMRSTGSGNLRTALQQTLAAAGATCTRTGCACQCEGAGRCDAMRWDGGDECAPEPPSADRKAVPVPRWPGPKSTWIEMPAAADMLPTGTGIGNASRSSARAEVQ